MATKKSTTVETEESISIISVERAKQTFHILSETSLIYHRFALKAWQELLLPRGPRTAADRAATLKHNPIEEYRSSVYRAKKDLIKGTRLVFPGEAFHQAMSDAALDLPGLKKAVIGRLCGVEDFDVNIYGVPQMFMSMVRNSDKNHTPDVRTRAALKEWGCTLTVWSAKPLVEQSSIVRLLQAAGMYIGIGDWRQQKGSGSHGLFNIVNPDDPDLARLMKYCGMAAQDRALEHPTFYDEETEELFGWFNAEIARRRDAKVTPAPSRRAKKALVPIEANGGGDTHATI